MKILWVYEMEYEWIHGHAGSACKINPLKVNYRTIEGLSYKPTLKWILLLPVSQQ